MTSSLPQLGHWTTLGPWRVWAASTAEATAADWIATVERLAGGDASLHRSKHADTYRWARLGGDVYVKVYRRYRRWTALKDWFRPSKAENVRRVSAALTTAGFLVPTVLAIGEERRGLGIRRSWCATADLGGEPVARRLAALADDEATLRAKRGILAAIGREVARLHGAGVVAGDLVPANVWIVIAAGDLRLAFLDHDRTRLGRGPTRWRHARRNLVQLNRVVLAGVGASDRLRVYRSYAAARGWSRATTRRHLRWVIAKTIARRRAERGFVGGSDTTLDLRRIMRAPGPPPSRSA